jgi:hypothetical protein
MDLVYLGVAVAFLLLTLGLTNMLEKLSERQTGD